MNDLKKYTLDDRGFTESCININLNSLDSMLDINDFINNYKISKYFMGKFFLKRLINKVFKYKLKKKLKWNRLFWDNIVVRIINVNLGHAKNDSLNNVSLIKNKIKKGRLKDIFRYQTLLNNNINLDYPLYIDSQSLNLLDANLNSNKLFMLDGSRRILAHLFNKSKTLKIYLISAK